MKETKLYKSLVTLKDRLAPMNWGERIGYIWTYYKETVFVTVAMVAIVVFLISTMVDHRKDIMMGGIVANVNLSEEATAYITSGYFEKLGGAEDNQQVNATPVQLDSLEDPAAMEMTYYNFTKTLSLLTDGQIDYLITDKIALEMYIAQTTYLDLRIVFPEDMLSAWNDKLIKLKTVDDDGKVIDQDYPVAIDISDLPFIKACTETKGPVYFGVAINAANQDRILDFWQYLHDWKAPDGKTEGGN